jgi:hypothetical protein
MAASSGIIMARGASGQTYARNFYIPDAAPDPLRFDQGTGASATSPDYCTFPEMVTIFDVIALAAPTATRARLTLNGTPTSQIVLYAAHLAALNMRPTFNLPIPSGARLGGFGIT